MKIIKFPEDFILIPHAVIPGAKQWYYETKYSCISIVGGASGLWGDGVNTFEMWDQRFPDPEGYLTIDDINTHLQNNPVEGLEEAV
jgi:hypothetical protein